ncbi:MAG: hypothetical protein U9Q78_03465 [Chloroflexota bacterium]|nr:hypothetical protein [Chloroflexota bacterium]
MLQSSYRTILGILTSILIVASGLWGLLTYRLDLRLELLHRVPSDVSGWGAIIILAIGVIVGWVTKEHILRRWELPGSIWTTSAAGVGGAWLGSILPSALGLTKEWVNIIGSIIVAFGMAWTVGQIAVRLWKGKD